MLNNFLERLSGRRLYERLREVLLDSGELQALQIVDADWPSAPSAPQVSSASNSVSTLQVIAVRTE